MGDQPPVPDGRRDLSALSGHVIVCGLDGVGLRTVEQLHLAGVSVVVIDDQPDPRLSRIIARWDVAQIVGSARLADTLMRAGLPGATAVVCVENDELNSLETALLVNELSPGTRLVVQLANAAVGHAVADVTGTGSVLDVAELAAPSLVEACLQRTSHELDLDGDGFVVAAVTGRPPDHLAEGVRRTRPRRRRGRRRQRGDRVPRARPPRRRRRHRARGRHTGSSSTTSACRGTTKWCPRAPRGGVG